MCQSEGKREKGKMEKERKRERWGKREKEWKKERMEGGRGKQIRRGRG